MIIKEEQSKKFIVKTIGRYKNELKIMKTEINKIKTIKNLATKKLLLNTMKFTLKTKLEFLNQLRQLFDSKLVLNDQLNRIILQFNEVYERLNEEIMIWDFHSLKVFTIFWLILVVFLVLDFEF